MKDLSVAQEYFICAVNHRGTISGFSTEKLVCLVAGGLLELKLEGCIEMDEKRVTAGKELPENMSHLRPLYEFVSKVRPVKIEKILEAYTYSFSDKELNKLTDAIGESLEAAGAAETVKTGLLGNKKGYVPSKDAIHRVIDTIRAEILEDGEVTEDVAALVILLDRSKLIKEYFSKFEQKDIKDKLKQIVDSPEGRQVKQMVDYITNMITTMSVLVAAHC